MSGGTTFDAYLATLGGEGSDVTDVMANRVRDLWFLLCEEKIANLPAPHSGPCDDGRFMFSWDKDEHHVEIEFVPVAGFEWFYRNRKTNELGGNDDEPISDLSDAVQCLRMVFA